MAKTKSIAEELGIFRYKSYANIPAAKKALITLKARQQGKLPLMVHAHIKAKMARSSYSLSVSTKKVKKK